MGNRRGGAAPAEKKKIFYTALAHGATKSAAADLADISRNTATAWAKMVASSDGASWAAHKADNDLPDPTPFDDLTPDAVHALDDFGFFRRRFFGRIASPWQEEAANLIVELLATPQKEFAVINCPPGAGKSTLFSHDIPAWLTARNRSIRGLIGSRTEKQASQYTGRLRRTFDRRVPVRADHDLLIKGRALDATATLIDDYGRFKSLDDLWRIDRFIVAQLDGVPIEEKEATWTAYGMDSGSLGARVDFIIWDDLVDKTTIRTIEATDNQREWWENEAETRLEPDGLLILQGQRLSSRDLYRHCLDMTVPVDLNADLDDDELIDVRPKYHHIKFKAHYDDRCEGNHKPSVARAYPLGCLLDPIRLPWVGSGGLAAIRSNRAQKFEVVYQQEDTDPDQVLVDPMWIKGGRIDGIEYPGCWDNDRDLCQLPTLPDGSPALTGDLFSVATVDPSPSKYWAVQWWIYQPSTERRFLMDLKRQSMESTDFLDWNFEQNRYEGLMEEWQQRSVLHGHKITHWIYERNSARGFFFTYNHVQEWKRKRGVEIVEHQTALNKADPELGVGSIANHYKWGRVRLPGKQKTGARLASMKLVDEVTRYPDGGTDDQVMAHWFLEWNLPRLYRPSRELIVRARPSWVGSLRAQHPNPHRVGKVPA